MGNRNILPQNNLPYYIRISAKRMELKSTQMGQRLAQHPYNKVRLLNAGIEVSGAKHHYIIPFNELINVECKRGIVWGELQFELPDEKVVRLHGTEWHETQQFYRYLMDVWQQWSAQMSEISAQVLVEQVNQIESIVHSDNWLTQQAGQKLQNQIRETFSALPLPLQRVEQFEQCKAAYYVCLRWLNSLSSQIEKRNEQWTEKMLEIHSQFFATIESTPLNLSQCRAIVNGEKSVLVLAGAGSGKTSVLVARAGWLLLRQQATPEQILLLAFGRDAAKEMDERLQSRLNQPAIKSKTFHALALEIIKTATNKTPKISELETDSAARQALLITTWQQLCSEKKAQAKGWREWLSDENELQWDVPEGDFWQDKTLIKRIAPRLESWLNLMRMHGGTQKEMIENVAEDISPLFQKRIKLMAPLLKAWKSALKEQGATDFSGLLHQAINLVEKGRFISPWKAILVDEFQDISPLRARLLNLLRQQNSQTSLFAVGDDWQAIYRFSGAELSLTTGFDHYFGLGAQCALDTTYRFNDRIGSVANQFVQQNPAQLEKPLNSLTKGNKKSVMLLPEEQLEALINKMSGYVTEQETILILGRYHHLKPELLNKAKTRWPKLTIQFMTIHGSKGRQADYVIILGLHEGRDGFPAPVRESIIEQGLLPQPEEFPDAEERRLLYVALTRAKKQVWLFYNQKSPSIFVEQLIELGGAKARKP